MPQQVPDVLGATAPDLDGPDLVGHVVVVHEGEVAVEGQGPALVVSANLKNAKLSIKIIKIHTQKEGANVIFEEIFSFLHNLFSICFISILLI